MEQQIQNGTLDDRRVKILDLLLQRQSIPEQGDFDLDNLIAGLPPEEYKKIAESTEFQELWKDIDLGKSLAKFLVENGLADHHGNKLELTTDRGRELKKQGSYGKLLEDERYIMNEARRVNELELEADRVAHRQYKINVLIAVGTCMAALYYLLEILDGFFGFYKFHH